MQDVGDALHAPLAAGHEAVQVRATDQARAGTERDCGDEAIVSDGSNIRPTSSATVPSNRFSDANSRASVVSRSNHQAADLSC